MQISDFSHLITLFNELADEHTWEGEAVQCVQSLKFFDSLDEYLLNEVQKIDPELKKYSDNFKKIEWPILLHLMNEMDIHIYAAEKHEYSIAGALDEACPMGYRKILMDNLS